MIFTISLFNAVQPPLRYKIAGMEQVDSFAAKLVASQSRRQQLFTQY